MESQIQLIKPGIEHRDKIYEFIMEFLAEDIKIAGGSGLKPTSNIDEWIRIVNDCDAYVHTGLVPATTFLGFSNDKLVGIINIRHELNDKLRMYGGHIGYSIVRSARRQGYGAAMLNKGLDFCRFLGIKEVLLTCNKDNEASRKTILRNNGEYIDSVTEDSGNVVLRFHINLS